MEYICPYCGSVEKGETHCKVCLNPIEWVAKIWHQSDFYYNQGLEMARGRNLSVAVSYLKQAIILNKYHIEARNLLGLIYFEIGQVGEALKEWIVSSSLKKQDNRAAGYMNEIQKHYRMFSNYKEASMLYNQSLAYLKQKNVDVAIIRLKKVVSIHPKFVQARVLLALSYMYEHQYYKANEQLKKVISIDKGHREALQYINILTSEDTSQDEVYERDYSNKASAAMRTMRWMDRGTILGRYFMYFLIGALGMFAIQRYLILPNQIKTYEIEKKQLQESEAALVEKIYSLSEGYKLSVAELEKSKVQLEEEVARYEGQVGMFTQKEKLNQVKVLVEERSYIEAAQGVYQIASSKLDESDKAQYEALKETIYPRAVDLLYNEGVKLAQAGNYVEAAAKLETALLYEPEEKADRKVLYQLGCSILEAGDIEGGKWYLNRIVTTYEGTSEANAAQKKLDGIVVN